MLHNIKHLHLHSKIQQSQNLWDHETTLIIVDIKLTLWRNNIALTTLVIAAAMNLQAESIIIQAAKDTR